MRASAVRLPIVLTLALSVTTGAGGDGSVSTELAEHSRSGMKIRLALPDKTLTATLNDSESSRDFASLLPLTLTLRDLFGREKYARLPRALAESGDRRHAYEVGQVIYWSPGPDVAVYYRDDGETIPAPGILVLGTVDASVEALNVPGSVRVTIELVDPTPDGKSDANDEAGADR